MTEPLPSHALSQASPEALLAEHAWARRLARRLVRDATLADDLAQEACVRALEHPPRHDLRAWLGGVVRNLARSERRARGRRAKREELAATPEALPSAADALARLAVQHDVVRAVLALDEPYRSTVVLRFYEDLPPRKIAVRLGVPVATVKTRLARGLAQLRAALDREHGGERTLALFLLPLARPAPLAFPWIAGALTLNALAKLGIGAALLVGLLYTSVGRRRSEVAAELAEPAEVIALALPASTPVLAPTERETLAPGESSPPSPSVAHPTPSIAGRVVDVFDAPVSGVALGLRETSGGVVTTPEGSAIAWSGPIPSGSPQSTSGVDGRFEISCPVDGPACAVVAQDERWEAVFATLASPGRDEDTVVVVAPRFRLSGRVTDELGNALAGVVLHFVIPEDVRHAIGTSLEENRDGAWAATSDAAGRFAFERVPSVAGATLSARLESFTPARIQRDVWSDDELEIALARPGGDWLDGQVGSEGSPVAGALVMLGYRAVTSDDDGAFRMPLTGIEDARELVAAAPGRLPARILADEDEHGRARWPEFVRLELDGAAETLAGVVVDAQGEPLSDQAVWLEDAAIVCFDGPTPIVLESVLAGARGPRYGTRTDARGRFELRGLDLRDYVLQVSDPHTGLTTSAGPFGAGERDVRIVQPTDQLHPVLRGRVVSARGTPVAGATVLVEGGALHVGAQGRYYLFGASGAQAKTDADGAFELHDVPRRAVLHVYAEHVADPELELTPDLDPDALAVTVDVWAHVRVTLTDGRADAFATLDARGEPLTMEAPNGGGHEVLYRQALVGGVSPVIEAMERAATLVLYRGDQEVERVPIRLTLGRVNELGL